MQKIILTRGLPGSGKSTWAIAYCKKNPDYIRISRDDMRNMRGTYWIPKQETLITQMVNACVLAALEDGKHVILDATNFGERTTVQMAGLISLHELDAKIEIKDFTKVPLEECLKNDLKRHDSVGKDVIMGFYDKYLKPKPPVIVRDKSLPDCIIADIDGTLAHRDARSSAKLRSPYEWERVGEDKLDKVIASIVGIYSVRNIEIIIMSGRDGVCRPQTEQWLETNKVPCDELHMRHTGDMRKDTIVKKELYEKHIKGKYNVLFVLDDRDCVVDMWRAEGLKCLQVEPGNF